MRVTYIGTPGDPDVIVHRGIEFERGKAMSVPDKHDFADDFRNNPTFNVGAMSDDDKAALAAVEARDEADAKAAKAAAEMAGKAKA